MGLQASKARQSGEVMPIKRGGGARQKLGARRLPPYPETKGEIKAPDLPPTRVLPSLICTMSFPRHMNTQPPISCPAYRLHSSRGKAKCYADKPFSSCSGGAHLAHTKGAPIVPPVPRYTPHDSLI